MENNIYRIEMSEKHKLEFYVCGSNEVAPYKPTKELGVVVFNSGFQLDASLGLSELDSLIKYLSDCREYISEYNATSTPTK